MECRKKMIKASLLFIFILFSAAITQESTPELYTPEIFQVNRAPAHNTSYVFQTVEQAKTGERENSDYYLSLNGKWKFHWVANAAERPEGFYQPNLGRDK